MTQPPFLPPEGWYPNPENPEQQRWWDGRAWTADVAVGAPLAPGAVPPLPGSPDGPAGAPAVQPPVPPAGGYQPYPPQPYPPQQQYPPYGGGQPGYPAYPTYPTSERGLLPDGARVAGWWLRALARSIDFLLLWIPATLIGLHWWRVIGDTWRTYLDQVQSDVDAGRQPRSLDVAHDGAYLRAFLIVVAIYAVVATVYEVVLLMICAATVGKLICGLRVRRWTDRRRLGPRGVGLRALTYPLLLGLPTVGLIYGLVDPLWPLGDRKKQALHDKAAGTAVVRKRDAVSAPEPGPPGP